MADERPTYDELERLNRRLARDFGALAAQKLKLAHWIAELLRGAGGRVVLHGAPLNLAAVHLLAEHRCVGIGHGPRCETLLELHDGLVEACPNLDCHRMGQRPNDEPGLRRERVEPALDPASRLRLADAERRQHPERN